MLESINPATGEIIQTHTIDSQKDIERKISQCQQAYAAWRSSSLEVRLTLCRNLSIHLKENSNHYAKIITDEMGKLLKESKAEIAKCAQLCDYYEENLVEFLRHKSINTSYDKSFVTLQPLGIILGIMPWNFPFWQVFRYALPNLLIGNTAALKHASNTTMCSLLLEKIFNEVCPVKHSFVSLIVPGKALDPIIGHPDIRGVTVTGSTQVGKHVAKVAGMHLKKSVMELGGSDPYIICADANLEQAVDKCVASRMLNAGQSCIAAKRFILIEDIHDEFIDKYVQRFNDLKPGCPKSKNTSIAPLATKDIRDSLKNQVTKAIEQGAQCLIGGGSFDQDGFYYKPTVLSSISTDMEIFYDETFGPVASMIKAKDIDEAIQLANKTTFGLGSAIFTRDIQLGQELATNRIQSGACFVNDYVKSDPKLPFGGIKESGYGRELSHYGLSEFANIKTICVKDSLD